MKLKRQAYRKPIDNTLKNLVRTLKHEELSATEKTQLLEELGTAIRDWFPLKPSVSLNAFMEYVKSGNSTLPFHGGWLEQPEWVREDFTLYRMVMDFHYLNDSLADRE